jgi:hypothetical protein
LLDEGLFDDESTGYEPMVFDPAPADGYHLNLDDLGMGGIYEPDFEGAAQRASSGLSAPLDPVNGYALDTDAGLFPFTVPSPRMPAGFPERIVLEGEQAVDAFDALSHGIENFFGTVKTVFPFLSPVGDALGSLGTSWEGTAPANAAGAVLDASGGLADMLLRSPFIGGAVATAGHVIGAAAGRTGEVFDQLGTGNREVLDKLEQLRDGKATAADVLGTIVDSLLADVSSPFVGSLWRDADKNRNPDAQGVFGAAKVNDMGIPQDLVDSAAILSVIPAFRIAGAGLSAAGATSLGRSAISGVSRVTGAASRGVDRVVPEFAQNYLAGFSRAFTRASDGTSFALGQLSGRTLTAMTGFGAAEQIVLEALHQEDSDFGRAVLGNRFGPDDAKWRLPYELATTWPMDLFALGKFAYESKAAAFARDGLAGAPEQAIVRHYGGYDNLKRVVDDVHGGDWTAVKDEYRYAQVQYAREQLEEQALSIIDAEKAGWSKAEIAADPEVEAAFRRYALEKLYPTTKDFDAALDDTLSRLGKDRSFDEKVHEMMQRDADRAGLRTLEDKARNWDFYKTKMLELGDYGYVLGLRNTMNVADYKSLLAAAKELDKRGAGNEQAFDALMRDHPGLVDQFRSDKVVTFADLAIQKETISTLLQKGLKRAENAVKEDRFTIKSFTDSATKRGIKAADATAMAQLMEKAAPSRPEDRVRVALGHLYGERVARETGKGTRTLADIDADIAKVKAARLKTLAKAEAALAAKDLQRFAMAFNNPTGGRAIQAVLNAMSGDLVRARQALRVEELSLELIGTRWRIDKSGRASSELRVVDKMGAHITVAERTKLGRAYDTVFGGVSNSEMRRQWMNKTYEEGQKRGLTTVQMDRFFYALHRKVEDGIGFYGVKMVNGIRGLPTREVNKVGEQIFGAAHPAGMKSWTQFLDRHYPGPVPHALARVTGGKAKLPHYPGWLAEVNHEVAAVWYPIIRFKADPRWWLMNLGEKPIVGSYKAGIGSLVREGQPESVQLAKMTGQQDAIELGMSKESIIGNRISAERLGALLDGAWADDAYRIFHQALFEQPQIRNTLVKHYGSEKAAFQAVERNLLEVGRALAADTKMTAGITALEKDIKKVQAKLNGGNLTPAEQQQFTTELNNLQLTHAQSVVAHNAVVQMTKPLINEYKLAHPVYSAVASSRVQTLRDLQHVIEGNPSRSEVQRLMNSYLLYWPFSYQFRVAKELARFLSSEIAGVHSGLAPFAAYAHLRTQHTERMKKDETYATWFKDHGAALQLFEQILPITPEGVGITLGGPTRIALHLAEDRFEPARDIERLFHVGPVLTSGILDRILEQEESRGIFDEDTETLRLNESTLGRKSQLGD